MGEIKVNGRGGDVGSKPLEHLVCSLSDWGRTQNDEEIISFNFYMGCFSN